MFDFVDAFSALQNNKYDTHNVSYAWLLYLIMHLTSEHFSQYMQILIVGKWLHAKDTK